MNQDSNDTAAARPCDVAIVGGGTAGLSLACRLRELGIEDVVILERESQAGGVPRHCGHYPFGLREYRRLLKGPAYAERLRESARQAGVRILTGTSVTALGQNACLDTTSTAGSERWQARRLALCTGTREGTRAQRFISGQRPLGVLPTGALQSLVYLENLAPFRRPVIIGTELVSLSAIMTCRHLGMQPVAMLEESPTLRAPAVMRAYPLLKRIPLHLAVSDIRILGSQRVEAVQFRDSSGQQKTVEADGVIVSGDFRPDSALLRGSHLQMDAHAGGPLVDQHYRSSDPNCYCTGNLLRPVETSGWCWQEARQTAAIIADELQGRHHPGDSERSIRLIPDTSWLKLVMPQRLSPEQNANAMQHLQLRLHRPVRGHLVFRSEGHTLHRQRLHGRPEQRILAPLKPLMDHVRNSESDSPIHISVELSVA